MLSINQAALQIATESIRGYPIDLSKFRGRKMLLRFHRFSGCPVAQRQLHDLIDHQNELNESGIGSIVFLHSTVEKILPVYQKVPGLQIIAKCQLSIFDNGQYRIA